MKLSRTFAVNRTAANASSAARAYLQGIGYRPRAGAINLFERGSLLGSWTSFSPRKWRARIALHVESADPERAAVRLDVDVNTTGQMVTPQEREYWDFELDGLQSSVASGELRTAEIAGVAEEIASAGKRIVSNQIVHGIAGAVATAIVAIIVAKCDS